MRTIRESIIGKRNFVYEKPRHEYTVEIGGLDKDMYRKYKKGEISYSDLTMNLVPKDEFYVDDKNIREGELLGMAQTVIDKRYKFPDIVYARVYDIDMECIDTMFGKNWNKDLK